MLPQRQANALARGGRLGPRAWRRRLIGEIVFLELPVIGAWRLRNALTIERLKAIGIFRIIGAITVARMGLARKHDDANGGKQSRIACWRNPFLHEPR
jgi:hypothetical protein